jgi:hypothetical protein
MMEATHKNDGSCFILLLLFLISHRVFGRFSTRRAQKQGGGCFSRQKTWDSYKQTKKTHGTPSPRFVLLDFWVFRKKGLQGAPKNPTKHEVENIYPLVLLPPIAGYRISPVRLGDALLGLHWTKNWRRSNIDEVVAASPSRTGFMRYPAIAPSHRFCWIFITAFLAFRNKAGAS